MIFLTDYHRMFKDPISAGEKQRLLKKSEISLWLDHYDDIFSDFDSRPYSERAISEDFLNETKRASRDKPSGQIELKFLIPIHQRNMGHEALIKKRLHEHFKKHHMLKHQEVRSMLNKGLFFVVTGIVLMFGASYLLFTDSDKNLAQNFLIILLEPAGWFFFWEGLRQVIFESKSYKKELEFYEKMARIEIEFTSY